jgi:hypothetical protein
MFIEVWIHNVVAFGTRNRLHCAAISGTSGLTLPRCLNGQTNTSGGLLLLEITESPSRLADASRKTMVQHTGINTQGPSDREFLFGDLRLDSAGLLTRGEEVIHLPPKELAALRQLLAHAG